MHAADIKASLHKAGSSCADIARRLRVSRSAVSQVVHGAGVSQRISAAIAKDIGMPVDAIWPARRRSFDLRRKRG